MHQLNEYTVIDIVEPIIGFKLSNICLKRNSYINRVFEIENADTRDRLIVKFYRPNRWSEVTILAEHQFLRVFAEFDLPVIPPISLSNKTLFNANGIFFALFPKRGGRALDEFDLDMWEQIGRLIGHMHLIGTENTALKQASTHRVTWSPESVTVQHLETILPLVPVDYQKPLQTATQNLIRTATPLFNTTPLIPLHGDCHRGNLIFRPQEGIYLIDFDDMVIGPAIQDLWMLLPDEVEACPVEIESFIEGYRTFFNFNQNSLKLIPYLQGMRLIHFAAWCAIQHTEDHFKDTFPDWGTPRYWNEIIKKLYEICSVT